MTQPTSTSRENVWIYHTHKKKRWLHAVEFRQHNSVAVFNFLGYLVQFVFSISAFRLFDFHFQHSFRGFFFLFMCFYSPLCPPLCLHRAIFYQLEKSIVSGIIVLLCVFFSYHIQKKAIAHDYTAFNIFNVSLNFWRVEHCFASLVQVWRFVWFCSYTILGRWWMFTSICIAVVLGSSRHRESDKFIQNKQHFTTICANNPNQWNGMNIVQIAVITFARRLYSSLPCCLPKFCWL